MMIFVNAPLETSLKRNELRDRKISKDLVKDYWHNIQKNIDKYKMLFDSKFILINNDNLTNEEIKNLWKKVHNFSKSPVENIIGKNWIEHRRRRKKNIKHGI